jgi:hypothetical protein
VKAVIRVFRPDVQLIEGFVGLYLLFFPLAVLLNFVLGIIWKEVIGAVAPTKDVVWIVPWILGLITMFAAFLIFVDRREREKTGGP